MAIELSAQELQKLKSRHQETFNQMIPAGIKLAERWLKEGINPYQISALFDVTSADQWNSFIYSHYYKLYKEIVGPLSLTEIEKPGQAFKLFMLGFDKSLATNETTFNVNDLVKYFNDFMNRTVKDLAFDYTPVQEKQTESVDPAVTALEKLKARNQVAFNELIIAGERLATTWLNQGIDPNYISALPDVQMAEQWNPFIYSPYYKLLKQITVSITDEEIKPGRAFKMFMNAFDVNYTTGASTFNIKNLVGFINMYVQLKNKAFIFDYNPENTAQTESNKEPVLVVAAHVENQGQELKTQQEQELKTQQEQELKAQQEQELKAQQEQELKAQQEQELKAQQEQELKAQQEQELKVQQEQEPKVQQEQEPKVQQEQEQEQELKVQQEQELKVQQEQEPKVRQEQEPKVQQEQEPKVQQEQEPKVQQEQEPKAQQEQELKAQQEQEMKAQQEQEMKAQQEQEPKAQQEQEPKAQQQQQQQQQQPIIVEAHSQESNGHVITKFEKDFYEHLNKIANKMQEFENKDTDPKYKTAFDTAAKLHKDLKNAGDEYFSSPQNQLRYDDFRGKCTTALTDARPILEKNRGWARILVNLLCMIALPLYLTAAAIDYARHGKFTFFATDTETKMDGLEDCVNANSPQR